MVRYAVRRASREAFSHELGTSPAHVDADFGIEPRSRRDRAIVLQPGGRASGIYARSLGSGTRTTDVIRQSGKGFAR